MIFGRRGRKIKVDDFLHIVILHFKNNPNIQQNQFAEKSAT